jgi:3-deoxy-D-manno-octulosonic-acid transferase
VGPHTGNFEAHVGLLQEAGALAVVPDADGCAGFVEDMLAEPVMRAAMGGRAEAALRRQGRLVEQSAEAVLTLLTSSARGGRGQDAKRRG